MLYNLFENRDFVSVFAVALLAEGVDRNLAAVRGSADAGRSPSSRRAWIEIEPISFARVMSGGSPSSRRAWIEIRVNTTLTPSFIVALLAEGVDRNMYHLTPDQAAARRPPRGGRG